MLLFLIAKIVNRGSAQEVGKDPRSTGLDSRELNFSLDKDSG